MGKHKPSSKTKKPKPQAKSARKPVKKTVPKPTKPKAKKAKHRPVANHPTKSPASSKSGKSSVPVPAHAVPKGKAAAPAPAPDVAKAKRKPKAVAAEAEVSRSSSADLRKQAAVKAKSRVKAQRAAAFTLDDVRGELAKARPGHKEPAAKGTPVAKAGSTSTTRIVQEIKPTHRRYGAASLADILGYNPAAEEKPETDETSIDKKFVRFYKLLVQLRDHVKSGLALHAESTLKRSSREDSGDLSGYGQHMADAGTDAFDRDFALSLVSNEQEALYEIEEAIKRIKKGTYGICELTGKPIDKERLLAVPFARYSVESQAEVEKTKRRSSNRAGLFGDAAGEEGAKITEDDGE